MSIINLPKLSLEKAELELMQCEKLESTFFAGLLDSLAIYHLSCSLTEDQFSTQKALQTVVAGQQAENLLYVDYDIIFMKIPS